MSTGGKLKMKIKVKKILSLVFTLLTIVLSSIGLALYFVSDAFDATSAASFLSFTINSNIFLVIVGLLFLIIGIIDLVEDKKLPQWVMQLKLASITLISITLLTVIFYLAPLWEINETTAIAYKGCNLYLHILAPIFAIVGFVLFDVETKIKWRWNWLGTLIAVIYVGVYMALIFAKSDLSYDIYNFVHAKNSSSVDYTRLAISSSLFIVGTYALTNLWWALNLVSYKCTYKEEKKPQEEEPFKEDSVKEETKVAPAPVTKTAPTANAPASKPAPVAKPVTSKPAPAPSKTYEAVKSAPAAKPVATKVAPAPAKKPVSKPANNLYNGNTRTYHISTTKSLLGKWQVKLAGGEKAIKVCATQQEAIDYTRELVKSQGGSIRLHSLDGRIRKI